jgi:hypothetical protein
MDAHRAALHDALDAGFRACLDNRAHRINIDGPILAGWNTRLPIRGGHVIHDLRAADSSLQDCPIGEVPDHQVDAALAEYARTSLVTNDGTYAVTASNELPRQPRSRESGRPGD